MEKRLGVIAASLLIVAAPVVVGAQPQKPTAKKPPAAASASASAAPTPAPPADAPPPARLEAAKDFFRKGNAEMEAGRFDRALDHFLQSRAQVPSIANTNNAALCLEKLGRTDEALDLYEELLVTFAPRLSSDERSAISNKVVALKGQVAFVEVSANVDGLLIIDGRRRGSVPVAAPVRVSPGTHVIRVLKDGHTPAEATVAAAAGQTVRVDLRLEVLTAAGRLRVTDAAGAAEVEVLVDGAPVGLTPWEGTLSPGRHLLALRGKYEGTAPTEVNVLVGQTVKAELRAQRLGLPLRVAVEPPTATLSIDGVVVGKGSWSGRLPDGDHAFQAYEEGYLTGSAQVGGTETTATLGLKIDEKHPRWRKPAVGKWRVSVGLGSVSGSGLGGEGEGRCPVNCSSDPVSGFLLGAGIEYHAPSRLFLTGRAGLLQAKHEFSRAFPTPVQGQTDAGSYQLDDRLSIRGPFAMLGVGYRLPLGGRFSLRGHVEAGAAVLKASDPIEATLFTVNGSLGAAVDNAGQAERGLAVLAQPSLMGEVRLGQRFFLDFGVGALISLLDGPRLAHGDLGPNGFCSPLNAATTPACTKATSVVAGERAFSRFVLPTPQLALGIEL